MLDLLIAAALATASPARPPAPCSVTRLDACRDTNQLVWTPGLKAALKRFFGVARGSYLEDDQPIYDQALAAMSGPPDDLKPLGGGLTLAAACRAHSCPEKGGMILDNQGRVLAFGLVNFHCHKVPEGQAACDRGPTLDVFVPHIDPDTPPLEQALLAWAKPAADADQATIGGIQGPFQGADVRAIGPAPAPRRPRP